MNNELKSFLSALEEEADNLKIADDKQAISFACGMQKVIDAIWALNKVKENFLYSGDDMIEFANWLRLEDTEKNAEKYFHYSDSDMLNVWKENRIKTIFYE